MKFKLIEQTQYNTCLHCVLAMIVGETEEYVRSWFKYIDPPLYDEDAFLFLAHHGIYLCLWLPLESRSLNENDEISIIVGFKGRPAYIVVESETMESRYHAVLWDGERVLDPRKGVRKLEEFKMYGFYPLMWTGQRSKKYEEAPVK